jgi:hypothetical protein
MNPKITLTLDEDEAIALAELLEVVNQPGYFGDLQARLLQAMVEHTYADAPIAA